MLERVIEAVSPRWALQRASDRAALDGVRSYAAAERGRQTSDWRARNTSADAELLSDLPILRSRVRQMVRDNPLMEAARRNLVVGLVGDGVAARATHADKDVAKEAQDIWDDHAISLVDGWDDHYGDQKLTVSSTMQGGETLTIWGERDGVPDGVYRTIEGDYLDHTLNRLLDNGGRIVGGIEFNKGGFRVAYHLHEEHPGDLLARLGTKHRRIEARDVDHHFEATRAGQTRGVPWPHASVRTIRDNGDIADAVRMKKRIEACVTLFRRPGEPSGDPKPMGERTPQKKGPDHETLRPGLIIYGQPDEEAPSFFQPTSVGDSEGFLRSQAMGACAGMGVPFHLASGDVSSANFTTLRADTVAYHARLDDWTQNMLVPRKLTPSFLRIMRREALRRRKPALLKVLPLWTPPPRQWVDPLKEIMAKVLEARAVPGGLMDILTERGLDLHSAVALQKQINDLFDANNLAMDTDPRRVNGAGTLQAPAGYLKSNGDDLGRAVASLIGQAVIDQS